MLTRQRQQHLLAVLKRDGRLVARDCAADLGLSEDTIRRDLRELARGGFLLRVHGGALPASQAVQALAARQSIAMPEKTALARVGARLIQPGQVAFLDGGTTALALVRALDRDLRATIVTHSPTVAAELVDHAVEVQLIGGRLFKHSMVAVGTEAAEAIRRIRADLYFMGVTGIHAEFGLTTGDAEEAAIKRAIAAAAAEVIVMASSEKIGAAAPFLIAPARRVGVLLVATGAPRKSLAAFEALGVEIVRVDGPG